MSNGPTLLFDKSTIQTASRSQAEWIFHFFRGVITPVFMSEVLGNLAKDFKGRSDPAAMVASLADKCQSMGVLPNVSHITLIHGELYGYPIELRGVPVLGGGQRVTAANGETGLFFDEPAECRVIRRWANGEFEQAEKERATAWRVSTKEIDLQALLKSVKINKANRRDLTELSDVIRIVDNFLNSGRFRALQLAMDVFELPDNHKHLYKTPGHVMAARHWHAWHRTPSTRCELYYPLPWV